MSNKHLFSFNLDLAGNIVSHLLLLFLSLSIFYLICRNQLFILNLFEWNSALVWCPLSFRKQHLLISKNPFVPLKKNVTLQYEQNVLGFLSILPQMQVWKKTQEFRMSENWSRGLFGKIPLKVKYEFLNTKSIDKITCLK